MKCGAGVRSVRLMGWQERLASLRDLLLWDHALHLGLRILAVAQPVKAQVSMAIPCISVLHLNLASSLHSGPASTQLMYISGKDLKALTQEH